MSKKAKRKPGIHLVKRTVYIEELGVDKDWYWWRIVAKNGRIIARSSETYSRKAGAVKSIWIASRIFWDSEVKYYDHTKPGSPLKSYL